MVSLKFPKSQLVKDSEEKKDMRKKLVANNTAQLKRAFIPNRIRKGNQGFKFMNYTPVFGQELSDDLFTTIPKEYSELIKFKTIDEIKNKMEEVVNQPVVIPQIPQVMDLKSMSLQELIDQEDLPIKITSGYRANSKTKSGNTSHHSRKDSYGNPMAYDIVPMFNGKVNTTQQGFELLSSSIINNPIAVQWFKDHNFGLLDETSKEMMQRTGATGKHFHIGPDKIALSNWNKLTSNKEQNS